MSSTQGRGITRNRERLACVECRRRKLRCDRHLPCSACVRRGDGQHCDYQRFANGADRNGDRQANLEGRLRHLEQLVQQVAPESGLSGSSDQGSVSDNNRSNGDGSAGPEANGKTPPEAVADVKRGATHWSSVWEDIQDLRLTIAEGVEDEDLPNTSAIEPSKTPSVDILFGRASPLTIEEVLAAYLPPRQEMDRYISAYFKTPAISASFLHASHFKEQYYQLWTNPLGMSPLKLAMVFSICHIAKNALGSGGKSTVRNDIFSEAAAHCLVIGEYFRPKRYTVEALLLFIQSLCLGGKTVPPDVAPIGGIASQVASMMGYYRDPESLGLTPFEAEMRRRVWSLFIQLDLLTSFHLGIPSSIRHPIDALDPPNNLHDSDFSDDCVKLPPSRPLEEPTSIQFCLVKHKFMVAFEKSLRHAINAQHRKTTFDEVDALDTELRGIFSGLPETLKPKPMSESVFDHPNLIVTRLCVLFIYCKSLCVLHRPYVLQRRTESIKACYDSAIMLMRGFCDAYGEFTPEGQAKSNTWFIASLTWHDFLLGSVSLCLSALIGVEAHLAGPIVNISETIDLLSQGAEICRSQGTGRGRETVRVRMIMEASIKRLRQESSAISVSISESTGQGLSNGNRVEAAPDGWSADLPTPDIMEDVLWDEYLGNYLHLDLASQEVMQPGDEYGVS